MNSDLGAYGARARRSGPHRPSRERSRHRARARHARLLGHLDRARERLRGPRDGGSPRPRPGPPGEESYAIRRVWLTKEEERGYYYGFANEGLWPLCHIAHTRPEFRASDWLQYERVNRRFAEAVCEDAFRCPVVTYAVRVGRSDASAARYCIQAQADIDRLLWALVSERARLSGLGGGWQELEPRWIGGVE